MSRPSAGTSYAAGIVTTISGRPSFQPSANHWSLQEFADASSSCEQTACVEMAALPREDHPSQARMREFVDVTRTLQFEGFPSNHLMLNCGTRESYSDRHQGKIRRKHLDRSSLTHQQALVETNAHGPHNHPSQGSTSPI